MDWFHFESYKALALRENYDFIGEVKVQIINSMVIFAENLLGVLRGWRFYKLCIILPASINQVDAKVIVT